MGEKFFWEKYINVEKDFLHAKKYMEFVPENYGIYSDFFSNEVILLGSLIETSLKYLVALKNPGCSLGNIGEIKQQILSQFPRIVLIETHLYGTDENFSPFQNWDTKSLAWWTSYTDVKHGILKSATLKLSLTMLAAFEIVLFLIHSEQLRNGEISNYDGNTTHVYYSFTEKPSFMIPKLQCSQFMDSRNIYSIYPISQYQG